MRVLAGITWVWTDSLDVTPAVRTLAAGCARCGVGLNRGARVVAVIVVVREFVVITCADKRHRARCRPTGRAAFRRGRPLQRRVVNAKAYRLVRLALEKRVESLTSSNRRPRDTIRGSG